MLRHFRSKIRVCGNRCHTLILKDKDNQKRWHTQEEWATKLLSRIFEILKILEIFEIFQHCFLFFKKKTDPNFKSSKNGIYVLEETLKNVCTYQVSSNSLQKRGFYSTLNVKNSYFSGHLAVVPCISIYVYSFYSDFYATNDVLGSFFRVVDEKPTHKHVLRRQMTEIGNLTS